MISPSLEGNQANRQSGRPGGNIRGASPSITITPCMNQVACGQPLLNAQRPSTTSLSSLPGRAVPVGANEHEARNGNSAATISFATNGSSQAVNVVILPMN